jgi:CRP-like cAMP-binding protein
VFEKGDPGKSMYIVVSGKVRVFDGVKTINFLGEQEIFGELALLDPEPRSASVESAEETRLFRLDRDTLFELMTDNVGVVSGIMQVLCQPPADDGDRDRGQEMRSNGASGRPAPQSL